MLASCDILQATPRFSRDAWSKHPNFPNHLLLLGSHKNFLSISATLVTRARHLVDNPTSDWRRDTANLFTWWQSGMLNHEHYEEQKLYPFLSQHYRVSLGALLGDHGELDDLRTVVTQALDIQDAPAILHAFTAFDTTLVRHLREEEELVIPMLLDLEPAEFRDYAMGGPAMRKRMDRHNDCCDR